MPRPEKVQAVAEIKERLDGAQAVFLTEYSGLSVKEQQQLRRELKANGAEMKVVKMTLARLAAEGMADELTELLIGPTALTFADGDPAAAAKALKAFSKDHSVLIIKGGLLDSEFLSPERISALADLPARDVMLATVAATLGAPMTQMAGLLAALPRNAATAFQQLLEKKEEESPQSPVDSPQQEEEAEESVEEAVEEIIEEAAVEEILEEAVTEKAAETPADAAAEPEDEDHANTED
jgi:large subunit ribosomal protein L10